VEHAPGLPEMMAKGVEGMMACQSVRGESRAAGGDEKRGSVVRGDLAQGLPAML